MIGVLVVDDHPVVLTGLAALMGSDPQLSVVGTIYLAPKTIRNRTSEMLGKLRVATRDEAVALARSAGRDARS